MKNLHHALLVATLTLSAFTFGGATEEVPTDGNKAYEAGEIDKALESYLSAVQQGYEGATLYYNIGNAYYKKGERGNAVLWYERALRLDPRDSDIQFNLSLARSHLKDEEAGVIEKIIFYFTDRELGFALLVLSWIFFGILGTVLLKRTPVEPWVGALLWTAGGFLIVTSVWFGMRVGFGTKPWAVIISPPGEVRNGPGLDYAVGFTIPEGSRVIILNKRPEWVQVGVPQQGLKGWVPASEVKQITSMKLS